MGWCDGLRSGFAMIEAAYVVQRLQDAHSTMALLPGSVGPQTLAAQSYGYVSEPHKGDKAGRIKLQPSREDIADMDEAVGWLSHIHNTTIRRIVSARSVVSPKTGKPAMSWARVAVTVGATAEAVRWWHECGILAIVSALNGVGK